MVVVYGLHLGFQNAFGGNNYVERKRRKEVMFRIKICKMLNEKWCYVTNIEGHIFKR